MNHFIIFLFLILIVTCNYSITFKLLFKFEFFHTLLTLTAINTSKDFVLCCVVKGKERERLTVVKT